MLAKILRYAGWLLIALVAAVCFGIGAYFSFNVFVRSGVTTVPDLAGLNETQAEVSLADHGLAARRRPDSESYDDEVPAGEVLRQSPGPGSLVKRGSQVDVRISLGPQQIEVPDLKATSLQAAQVALTSAGLRVGRTASVYGSAAAAGTVADQEPEAGVRVGRNAPVDLFVCQESRLETYLMPDLVYRDFQGVRRFFERRGFRLGNVRFEPYEGLTAGVVLRQFPLPGHPLRRRDVISLVVAGTEVAGV